MKSQSNEEKKINSNQEQNPYIKKIKLNKDNYNNTFFSFPKSKNINNLNKNKKAFNKTKTKSVDSIYLRTLHLMHKNQNNNTKIKNSIRSQIFKIRKINQINETSKMNSNFNLYKSTLNKNNTQIISTNISESVEHKLLYEDIIKLKNRLNKLKMELSFLKSLNRKKDEEIRELEKYKEEAKYYQGKNDNNIFFQKLKFLKEIVKLKNIYEDIKIKLRKQKEINNNIMNQIKSIDITELKNECEESLKLLKKKLLEFNKIRKINLELEQKINKTDWAKTKFIENHQFLIKLKLDFNEKKFEIKILQEKASKLKDKYDLINSNKDRILRRNSSIKSDNKKLLKERKTRQDYIIKQIEIQKQITSFENKTQILKNEISENEQNIYDISFKKNTQPYYMFKPYLEQNPNDAKEKQVTLYESLILDSKKKQNVIVEKIMELIEENDIMIKRKNYLKIKIKNNNYDDFHSDLDSININNMNDNSQIFGNNSNINSSIKDINIEDKDEIFNKKKNELIFILNIIFYIRNIEKEKIKNILLNYKTENYYVASLKEKNSFLMNLSSEILKTIQNKTDINNLKDILLFLLDNKYKDNKIQFLNEVINDIFILENENKILFNFNEEKILFGKLEKIFSKKNINSIISKLKNIKTKIISYENLKSLLTKEQFFSSQENIENTKLFQFFIYILKKKEDALSKKYALKEFNVKIILEFFSELKQKEKDNYFLLMLNNFLNDKDVTLEKLLGSNDFISISEFINILNQNEFKIDNDNSDINVVLQKYQKEEKSGNIDINLLKKDLNSI